MTKGNGNPRGESRPSLSRDKRRSSDEEGKRPFCEKEKQITITVQSIENIDENISKEIIVKIDFFGITLNQSLQIPIENSRANVGLNGFILIEDTSPCYLDEILSNPILFTVTDCSGPLPDSISPPAQSPSPNLETKKKTSKTSDSPASNSKILTSSSNVLGLCNLDIGKLVYEKEIVREILLVEPDKKMSPPDFVPWTKLPKLVVVATSGSEPLIPEAAARFNNVIGVTVESIYNAPEYIAEGTVFDAVMFIPSIDEKTRKVKFPNGLVTCTRDPICRKKWLNLNQMETLGARTKQSVSPSVNDVINTVSDSVNLDKEIKKNRKTIQWNMWKNSLMMKNDSSYLYSKIARNHVWPIEIVAPNKAKEQIQREKSAKSDKKSKTAPPTGTQGNGDHFTAFLNLTSLLCPGVTKIRVAAQLFTYSLADLISKFGEEYACIYRESFTGTIRTKAPSVKSKASFIEHEGHKDSSGSPVSDEQGSPTFIIVEVELAKPFSRKRDIEKLDVDLRTYLSVKGKMSKKTLNLSVMKEAFSQTIQDTVSILTNEYQEFFVPCENGEENQSEDSDIDFQRFLIHQKNFYKIKTTLENKVIGLINEKFGTINHYKEKIPEIYVFLVNEMHKVTNSCLTGREKVSHNHYNDDVLQLYAEEALEEGNTELAQEYTLLKLSRDTFNPDYWLDCAVCYISLKEIEKATEAVKEALCLDFHHPIGLLMYALLMAIAKNGTVAEMTFEILLSKYPDFIEAWMALRLFYLIKNNSGGGLLALREAKKIEFEKKNQMRKTLQESEKPKEDFICKTYSKSYNLKEKIYGVASLKNGRNDWEPLSWTTSLCPPNSINVITAVLLQKLGFYEFALMSLTQELVSCEFVGDKQMIPPYYIYYTSVNYYLQGQYGEAVPLLQKIVKEYGKDCYFWSLLGHCYYKLENHRRAIACYEYVIESYNRPDDIHLVYSRMGFYYIQANKFPCAKRVLVTACKYSPTPKLWKGIGIASLRMKEAEEAEIAFSEANCLDNKDPETWAYLALTNAMLRRLDLFKQCYSEAEKRRLKNKDIIRELKDCEEANGLKVLDK